MDHSMTYMYIVVRKICTAKAISRGVRNVPVDLFAHVRIRSSLLPDPARSLLVWQCDSTAVIQIAATLRGRGQTYAEVLFGAEYTRNKYWCDGEYFYSSVGCFSLIILRRLQSCHW